MNTYKDAWVEVDLEAISHNTDQVRSLIGEKVKIMAVVKADAYGHGAVKTAGAVTQAGANALAVTRLQEAAVLRNAGVQAPILIFDSIQPEAADYAVTLGVEMTVCTDELIAALSDAAKLTNTTARVHLKIDTGMGRLGVLPTEAVSLAKRISEAANIELAGTYTHFATAIESDLASTRKQIKVFAETIELIKQAGVDPGLVHAANSGAILRLPESHFDMVRPGTILYGQYPSRYVPRHLSLKNTWRLKTRISFIKTVPKDTTVGYGSEFVTQRESRIAVIPLGWADGLTVIPESAARRSIARIALSQLRHKPIVEVEIRGERAPVVGRIAMQMCSVDVTDVPGVVSGDEVTVPARRITTNPLIPRVYTD